MKCSPTLSPLIVLLWVAPVFSDTIFRRTPGDLRYGNEQLVIKDVIVINERPPLDRTIVGPVDTEDWIYYYRWDADTKILRDEYLAITKESTSPDAGRFRVALSPPGERATLIKSILGAGIRVRVTDRKGRATDLFCVKVAYRLPGYINHEEYTQILVTDDTTAKVQGFALTDVASLVFRGDEAQVTLKSGSTVVGRWRGRKIQNASFEQYSLQGLDQSGKRVRVNLDQIYKLESVVK